MHTFLDQYPVQLNLPYPKLIDMTSDQLILKLTNSGSVSYKTHCIISFAYVRPLTEAEAAPYLPQVSNAMPVVQKKASDQFSAMKIKPISKMMKS